MIIQNRDVSLNGKLCARRASTEETIHITTHLQQHTKYTYIHIYIYIYIYMYILLLLLYKTTKTAQLRNSHRNYNGLKNLTAASYVVI